jgi:hypothetical protein
MYPYTPNTSKSLETQTISVIPPTPMAVPQTIVKPISYQFQVVEYTKDDKIVKVELQVQETIHDERGNVVRTSGFTAVPRIQLPYVDHSN